VPCINVQTVDHVQNYVTRLSRYTIAISSQVKLPLVKPVAITLVLHSRYE